MVETLLSETIKEPQSIHSSWKKNRNNCKIQLKMKLILAVLASTLLICECAFQTKDEISNSLAAYEKFLRATTRNGIILLLLW